MAIRNINEPSKGAKHNKKNVRNRFNGGTQQPEVDDANNKQDSKSERHKELKLFIATNKAECDITDIPGLREESTERYNKTINVIETSIINHQDSRDAKARRLSKTFSENRQISWIGNVLGTSRSIVNYTTFVLWFSSGILFVV